MGSFSDEYTLKRGIIVHTDHSYYGNLGVKDGKIVQTDEGSGPVADFYGYSYIYPGLINTHDHLRGNYLPRVGPHPGSYYLTWYPWDNDLKASPCYAERSKALDVKKGYELSAYKTLFSGVTTVNDHFPHNLNCDILPTLPIRAIQNYAIAHECSSYELKWGGDINEEFAIARDYDWPFITHLAEGFDDESMDGLLMLEDRGVLDKHCLFVHCLAFSDEDIQKCGNAGASISWCGASNMLMFNTTCKIKKFLEAGVNVTIGTDSSHTGEYNMLEEIKFDRALYRMMYGGDLPAQTIFQMITENAAKALWMEKEIGSLDPGKLADILVLRATHDDPYENLINAYSHDIQLLICGGRPIYGEERFLDLFDKTLPNDYTMIVVDGRKMFVTGNPAELYRHIRRSVGFKKELAFLPFDPDKEG